MSSGELDFVQQILVAVSLIVIAIVSGYLGRMFSRAERMRFAIICYVVTLIVFIALVVTLTQFSS